MAEKHDLSIMENSIGGHTNSFASADKLETADIALVGVPHSTGNGTIERDQRWPTCCEECVRAPTSSAW